MPHVPQSGSSAELLPWKSHQPGLCSQEPASPSLPSPQQLRACLQPREGHVQPSEAIVQGRQGRRAPPSWPLGKGIRINGGLLLDRGSSRMRVRLARSPIPAVPWRPELQALCIRSQAPVLGKVEAVERMHRKTGKRRQGGQKPPASRSVPPIAALLPAAASAGQPSGAASEGVLQPQIWPLPSRAVAMLPEFNHPVSSEEPRVPEGGRTLPTESPYSGSKADSLCAPVVSCLTHHLLQSSPGQSLHRPSSALG